MKFRTETVQALSELGENGVVYDLIRYDDQYVGSWRWGDVRLIVFGPNEEGAGKYAFEYRTTSGDVEYESWDDEWETIEAYPVKGVPVTTVTWERI